MKLKRVFSYLIYCFMLSPIVYIMLSVKLNNSDYVNINYLTLNWLVGSSGFRHYMNCSIYAFAFVCAILAMFIFIKRDKIFFLFFSYIIMLFANISFINNFIEPEVYVSEVSSHMSNPIKLDYMNIIYATGDNRIVIANLYVYIAFIFFSTVLLVYSIYKSNKLLL